MMNDLLDQMSSDSTQTDDKLSSLTEGKLDAVSRLAGEAAVLEEKISNTESDLKKLKASLFTIIDDQLPEALEEMNLREFEMTDGSKISVKPIYSVSIPKDRREEAYQWLRDNGFGDMVKNNVTVTFGRGEDETAKEFVSFCQSQGYNPSQLEKVESATSRGWLRECVEGSIPIPMDLFGAFIATRAIIKRGKKNA